MGWLPPLGAEKCTGGEGDYGYTIVKLVAVPPETSCVGDNLGQWMCVIIRRFEAGIRVSC